MSIVLYREWIYKVIIFGTKTYLRVYVWIMLILKYKSSRISIKVVIIILCYAK